MVRHRIMRTRVIGEVIKKLGERDSLEMRLATLDDLIGEMFLIRGRLISGEWPLREEEDLEEKR